MKKFIVKKKMTAEYVIYESVYADDKDEAQSKAEAYYDVMDLEDAWMKPKKLSAEVISVRNGGKTNDTGREEKTGNQDSQGD